jgi:DNA polymerase epsilon subunit 1
MFIQLVAEFKRLGATIVSVNYHKIAVSAGKETMDHAQPYLNLLFRALQTKQNPEILGFQTNIYWDVLLWLDKMNHASTMIKQDVPTKKHFITKMWNIECYLPVVAHGMLSKQVAGYIYQIHQLKRDFLHDAIPGPRVTELESYVKNDMSSETLSWVRLLVRKRKQQSINRDPEMSFFKIDWLSFKHGKPSA